MAFSTLSLSTITGVQGRPYRAVLSGLQADSRIEIGGDGSPGFSYVNGRFSSQSLPYAVSTLVFDEIRPGEGRKQWRFDISAAGAPVASVAGDGTITYTGAGGGAPTAQAGTASNAGPVYTIARLLGSTSTLSLITGTNSNLTLNATTGVISATAAIAVGASQTAVVSETNGSLRVDYPVVVTGVSATPTPTPTPTPTLTLSATSPSIASNAASGTLVSNISNVPAGATPTVTPNDGRLVVAGDASAGWKVVVGMSAISAGTINFSVAATGATGASGVLTVTAVAGVVAYSLHPRTEAYRSASVASGSTPTAGELNRLNRFHAICDEFGITPALAPAVYQRDATEGRFRINLMQPGTYDLVPVGSPTYSPDTGAGGFGTNVGYKSAGLTAAVLDPAKAGIFFNSGSATTSSAADAGFVDGTAGLLIFSRLASPSTASSRVFSTGINSTNGGFYAGLGWVGAHRTAEGIQFLRHGVFDAFVPNTTTTPTASVSTNEVGWGWATGAANGGVRVMRGGIVSNGLSNIQARRLIAALNDLEQSRTWGCPMIYPKGVGPTNQSYDIIVESCNAAGIFAAYEAKQENPALSVAIVGAHLESTAWHLGGHWTNGLAQTDVKNFTKVAGKVRDMLTFANLTVIGRSDTTDQTGVSPDSRSVSAVFRRMLDPSRTSGAQGSTLLPGLDIPVIMTGGIVSVAKTGNAITSVTTADGRTLSAKVFIAQGYDGDLIRLSGAPVQYGLGTVADGGGYRTNLLKPQSGAGGTQYNVSVFKNPSDPASGYINGVIDLPALSVGDEDTDGLQPLNIRQTWSSAQQRAAPFGVATVQPDGYNAADYEIIARAFAAGTAAGVGLPIGSLLKIDPVNSVFDINAGECRVSTDYPNSGILYHRAGSNLAARSALMVRIAQYIVGFNWWLLFSGDSRIPASVVTAMQGYYLDPLSHLDPGDSGIPLNYGVPYKREPLVLLKNAGYKFSLADMAHTDGTTPANTDTATVVSYAVDLHSKRSANDGTGNLVVGGAVYNANAAVAGGADFTTPFSVKGFMTDVGVISNVMTSVAVSSGRDAFGSYRMENTVCQGGQTCGKYAALAAAGDGVVHNVPYATVRSKLLADPDNTKLNLQQVN